MKTFIFVSVFSIFAQAQVYFKGVNMCSSWTYSNGYYVCSSFPLSEYIPDQYSLNNKIKSLETRIEFLEKKLAAVESKIPAFASE